MRTKKLSPKGAALRQVPLFSACNAQELELAASLVDETTIRAGQPLITEGETGWEAFVITEGRATVSLRGDHLADLGPGDAVGEMALLDREPRSATVTAETDVRALVLTIDALERLLEETRIAKSLLRAMAQRLRAVEDAPHW
jgi:CRP/FNR family transcriptional regulator, cyclic AMP receptor protein